MNFYIVKHYLTCFNNFLKLFSLISFIKISFTEASIFSKITKLSGIDSCAVRSVNNFALLLYFFVKVAILVLHFCLLIIEGHKKKKLILIFLVLGNYTDFTMQNILWFQSITWNWAASFVLEYIFHNLCFYQFSFCKAHLLVLKNFIELQIKHSWYFEDWKRIKQ